MQKDLEKPRIFNVNPYFQFDLTGDVSEAVWEGKEQSVV